jgi:hypothetical protein
VTAGPYVVQADTQLTWEGETTFVKRGTVVEVDPATALGSAYGGSGNLQPLVDSDELGSDDADEAGTSN